MIIVSDVCKNFLCFYPENKCDSVIKIALSIIFASSLAVFAAGLSGSLPLLATYGSLSAALISQALFCALSCRRHLAEVNKSPISPTVIQLFEEDPKLFEAAVSEQRVVNKEIIDIPAPKEIAESSINSLFIIQDLFFYMCTFLPFEEAVSLNVVCKTWKQALDKDDLWKFFAKGIGYEYSYCGTKTYPLLKQIAFFKEITLYTTYLSKDKLSFILNSKKYTQEQLSNLDFYIQTQQNNNIAIDDRREAKFDPSSNMITIRNFKTHRIELQFDVGFNSSQSYHFKLHNSHLVAYSREKNNIEFLYIWDLTKNDLFNTGTKKYILPNHKPINIYDNQVVYYSFSSQSLTSIDLLTGLSMDKKIKLKKEVFGDTPFASKAFFENKVALMCWNSDYNSNKIIVYDYVIQERIYSTSHVNLFNGKPGSTFSSQCFFNDKYLILELRLEFGSDKKTLVIIWDLSNPKNNKPVFEQESTDLITASLLEDNFFLIKVETTTAGESRIFEPINLDTLISEKLKIPFSDS